MTVETQTPLMTSEEFYDLPDDGIERELVRGVVRIIGEEGDMTRRNPTHGSLMAGVTGVLRAWNLKQPEPRGKVYAGEVGFRISRNPDTTKGIDVAYASPATAAATPKDARFVDGPPVLAVEILSPSETVEDIIIERVQEYLKAGTKVVWLLEPVFETVTVYRPDAPPIMLSGTQELSGEPHLPGFRCVVAELFTS